MVDSAEIVERVRRSHNIIIRRLPETSDSSTDDGAVRAIVGHVFPVGVQHIVSHGRIGAVSGPNPRPVLVRITSSVTALSILRNKKILSTAPAYRKIQISDDITPNQFACLQKAREELRLRQLNGESDITIKYVMRGVPTVVKAVVSTSPKK